VVVLNASRLSGKVEQDPAIPRHLQTVWGVGYPIRGRTVTTIVPAPTLAPAHHGTIAVANAGAGCRFMVSLPLADSALT